MTGYDYLRQAHHFYRPRTPKAALRAVEVGLLPDVAYIYKAGSVKPLFEEPVDIAEVERILARQHYDLATDLLIMGILQKLLSSRDSEVALFAAESVNTIETRYNARIEKARKELEKGGGVRLHREIAKEFYALALLSASRPGIKRFYLGEAYSCMKRLRAADDLQDDDIAFMVELLLEMRLYELARRLLSDFEEDVNVRPRFPLLSAKVEFCARKYSEVPKLLLRVEQHDGRLPQSAAEIVRHWTEL